MSVVQIPFDTNLFSFNVGRLEIDDPDQFDSISIQGALRQAYSEMIKVVYIYGPVRPAETPSALDYVIPGILVDEKTTYTCPITKFSKEDVIRSVYLTSSAIRVSSYPQEVVCTSESLKRLAIASGQWSRFKVDPGISRHVFEQMFEAWISNSVNRSIADEVFVARDCKNNDAIVGFLTLKRRGDVVNIGLLAVADTHRRRGIARTLLNRAVLWAAENTAWSNTASLSVVTQGANSTACSCYSSFGFSVSSVQSIYHAWLPLHLEEPRAISDHGIIPFCKQHFTGKELHYVQQVLSTGLDSASRFTSMCSAKIKDMMGPDCDRVVMVPSGTAALEMAAILSDIVAGDEVIMPSFTFSSTANAFVLRGAVPVFVDIREDTLNIDETQIESAITARTRAICCVHYAGVPCEMDTICDIARRHNLVVIEDAAQGFQSTYKGRPIGSIGDFGCFSFHYTKNVICGEGGALCVNRSQPRAARALVVWEKGTNRYDFVAGRVDKYEWIDVGSSFVPSEVSCAILWAQLQSVVAITETRIANFEAYHSRLEGLRDRGLVRIPVVPPFCTTNGHIFYIILPTVEARVRLAEALKKKGISAFSHYVPLHSAPAGRRFGRVPEHCNMLRTQAVFDGLLRLPMSCGLTSEEREVILNIVDESVSSA